MKARPVRTPPASQERQCDESGRRGATTSIWEWISAAIGLALTLGIIGYIGWSALQPQAGVPVVVIERRGVDRTAGGYVVRFRAYNRSGVTAAALQIKGELRRDGAVVERSEARLDYLPASSSRDGGLIFREDPGAAEIVISPGGYSKP